MPLKGGPRKPPWTVMATDTEDFSFFPHLPLVVLFIGFHKLFSAMGTHSLWASSRSCGSFRRHPGPEPEGNVSNGDSSVTCLRWRILFVSSCRGTRRDFVVVSRCTDLWRDGYGRCTRARSWIWTLHQVLGEPRARTTSLN